MLPEAGARDSRPRVLIVNWRDIRNPEAGGAEVHLQETARRLVRDGFHVVQYAHAFPGAGPRDNVDGVEIHRAGGAFLFNYTAFFRLRRWVRRHRIDVVLDDSNKIVFLLPWISPVPVVARFHHLFGASIFRETGILSALYVFFFEGLIRFAYRNTPVLTVSHSTRLDLEAKGLRRIAIAPNGVDRTVYRVLPDARKDPFLIAHVGRLKRYKKLDTLIHALARVRKTLPEARLVVGGTGEAGPGLEKLARELGIADAVEFRGYLSGEDKVRLYNEASVFVNASLKEGWGLTSVEANACGTPVVATDAPGLRDSVRHGETGLLVPPDDPDAFAGAVLALLGNPERTEKMQSGALEWAAAHDWDRAFEVTRDVLMQARRGGNA